MKNIFFATILLLFFAIGFWPNAAAQDAGSGATVHATGIQNPQFQNNLDSLFLLSYVQNSIEIDSTHYKKYGGALADSVYENRLNELNTIVDLTYNDYVKRFIEFYTRHNRRKVEVMLALAQHHLPMFDKIIREQHLPLELKYLPVSESAMFPRAVSMTGASGHWQLLYSIGKMYGLNITTYTDERRDLQLSSEAAAEFLVDMFHLYNDWLLAIAAYNCGPGNVNKAINRSGGKTDFWEIYEFLPEKEREYVPAFIATVYLMNYYSEHEIKPATIQFPENTEAASATEKVHFGQIAQVLDVELTTLRDINPVLKKDIVPVFGDTVNFFLPKGYAAKFNQRADSIYAYQDSVYFKPRQIVVASNRRTPPPSSYQPAVSDYEPPSIEGKTKLYYTVKSGDNVGLIAAWYGVRISDMRYWNNLNRRSFIRAGQKLVVYIPDAQADRYRRVNTMSFAQKQQLAGLSSGSGSSSESSSSSGSSNNAATHDDGNFIYYTILPGDNLWEIAKHYPGVSNTDIMRINGFSERDARDLKVGQVIKIKRKD